MRARDRVERTRRALAATIAVRALTWSAAAALGTATVMLLLARFSGLTGDGAMWAAALLVGAVVFGASVGAWRQLTMQRVALWIEERVPSLQFALVTAVDPGLGDSASARQLEHRIDGVSWHAETRRAILRALARPATAAIVAIGLLIGARRLELSAAPADGARVSATKAAPRDMPAPFTRLRATVQPPMYAGGGEVTIESPASITALVGSTIALRAPGSRDGISADAGGRQLRVDATGDGWRVALTMASRPEIVRLRHALGERLVALEPRPDSAPGVRLTQPARDTVLRAAQGLISLAADVRDDLGLVTGAFEYIVSSGEGESFRFRSGTIGARQFSTTPTRPRAAVLSGSLRLETLRLGPGDIVHIRAVARDANSVSGPGVGASETRVVRIARASEYDSVAVEGAPPPEADQSLISQRMLIMLTEALERRRPRLLRETLLTESRAIGRDQTRLRKRVGDIIFARLGDEPTGEHAHGPDEEPHEAAATTAPDSTRRDSVGRATTRAGQSLRAAADSADSARAALLRAADAATRGGDEILDFEGDETPVVAINRPLLEAYNAMWEASRELEQGEPARALPPMRRALDAIQRARQAERIYLRGKAPAVVVDLARVRLTGKEPGGGATRSPRPAADPAAARRAERLALAMTLAGSDPAAAVDSLVLLRVESLDTAPAFAVALGTAIDALRGGRDATALLARARRIAGGALRVGNGLGAWSGVW